MNFDNDGGAKGGSNVHTKLFLVENKTKDPRTQK